MITHEFVLENFEYRSDGLYWRKAGKNRRVGTRVGTLDKYGRRHVNISINGKPKFYKEHRLCWLYMTGQWPKDEIDHKDRNHANNSWINLREATRSQNNFNRNFDGIWYHKVAKKWQANLVHNGKNEYLGLFTHKEDALAARRAAELKYFGEFAPDK